MESSDSQLLRFWTEMIVSDKCTYTAQMHACRLSLRRIWSQAVYIAADERLLGMISTIRAILFCTQVV